MLTKSEIMKKILYTLLLLPLFSFGQNNVSIDLQEGWNMFGYVCQEPVDVIDGLSIYTDFIVIVKNSFGAAYLPEWGFNGIGNLDPGYGYQIKLTENIADFTLCEWSEDTVVALQAELDSLYEYGCMDSLACNFDVNHIYNDFSCTYTEVGYDCDGNITEYVVGMLLEGGIVFHIDETGEHGLVAALEDIGQFTWGCSGTSVSDSVGQAIGVGLQNTLEIMAECSESPIAASEAFAYESEGYTDWYLPSFDELEKMYRTIGQGSSNGNKGGFSDLWYWTSSEADIDIAWSFSFNNGTTYNFFKSSEFNVRAIRSF